METRFMDDGQSWYYERYESADARAQRRGLAVVVLLGIVFLQGVERVLLLRQPQRETVVIQQDPVTGAVSLAPTLADVQDSRDEALSHWNLVRYLTARETYDPAGLQQNYDVVYAGSSSETWAPYAALYAREQPGNLIDRYQQHTQVTVDIKNVSFVEPGRALVRFATRTQAEGTQKVEHWVSTVGFRYREPARTHEARTLNPMGFEVTQYRRDQEVVHGDQ